MQFGIRQKFFSGFVVIILLFTGTCLLGITSLKIVVTSLERILAHPMVVSRASQDIEVLALSIQRNMYGISLSRNKSDIENQVLEIKHKEDRALELITLIQKQIIGNKGKSLALDARNNFYRWRTIRNKAIAFALGGKYDEAQKINTTDGEYNIKLLQTDLDNIGSYAVNKANLFTQDSISIAKKANIIVLSSIALSVLISIFISFYLSLSIIQRLKSISMATSQMTKGNMKQVLELKGNDELTQLAGNFNIMAAELYGMYENLELKVKERTSQLNEANERLLRVKSELEDKVNERTADLEEKINELNRSQLAMLYMIEDMNETSRQLKLTQEELIRKERFAILGQFSGNISHELRNPLGVIDSSLYYLQMRLNETDEKVHQHLDRIGNSVKTATAIIENLLNLTRMVKPVLTRDNLTNLLTDCLKSCKIPDTVNVVEDFEETEIIVSVEKEQIRMVVNNLVKNALAAMNGEGTFTIRTHKINEEMVEMSFADTGIGIDPVNLNQVFLPLFSTKSKGIGLGLSITKMIVENHKGKISVEAESGKGAKFIIRLPVIRDDLKYKPVSKEIKDEPDQT